MNTLVRCTKELLKNLIIKIVNILPIKLNYIIFESYPELDGSPWMIYKELKRRNFDKKYRLVWFVDKNFKSELVECVYGYGQMTIMDRFKRFWTVCLAKTIVDSNRAVRKINPRTIRVFTRHGGSFKKSLDYMHGLGKVDFMLTLSESLQKIDYEDCQKYCVQDIDCIVPLGFPANDRLFENVDLWSNGFYPKHLLNNKRFKKIIGWLPTFRQHRIGTKISSAKVFPFGIPLIQSEEELLKLNDVLTREDILLAIQMHHAQKKNFAQFKFSNIILISQEIKYEMGISTANLLHSFDAMITDYSAAYYEYILLDRPIALSIDDFEEYSSKTGFCFDYFDWIKGEYLRNVEDLYNFIGNVSNEIDVSKNERKKSMKKIHCYADNHSTDRVVEFLIKKANL